VNFIKQLQAEVESAIIRKERTLDSINELSKYLQSNKFWADPTVQVADVLSRLQDIKSAATD
jgi:hypothetical protein